MINNRDLLVNAARAAEIQGKYYVAYDERYINEGIDIGNGRLWNPLTRNEDAFSLMVNMYMDLDVRDNEEGEISILKNEIYKMTIMLWEQSKTLQKRYQYRIKD